MSILNWRYFIALDSDLYRLSRYVEICEDNYSTHSIEFARIILAASSEIDVVAKSVCKKMEPKKRCENINDYRRVITKYEPDFHKFEVLIKSNNEIIKPWEDWKSRTKNPDWWKKYNSIKHKRHIHYKEANLKNALYSVSGLFAIILCLAEAEYYSLKLTPFPQLFDLIPKYAIDTVVHARVHNLPYLKH